MQSSDCQKVDVDPNWSPPVGGVVLRVLLHVKRGVLGERPEAVWGVEKVGVGK